MMEEAMLFGSRLFNSYIFKFEHEGQVASLDN